MAINPNYELHALIRDVDGIRTCSAKDLTSGDMVEVHLFVNSHSMESKALLRKLVTLPKGGGSSLLDFGEGQGTPYVVTRALSAGFREWIVEESRQVEQKRLEKSLPMPVPVPAPPVPPKPLIDDAYAQVFNLPPPPPPAPTPEKTTATDEFNDLFEAKGQAKTLQAPAPSPGEFTRLFHSGQPPQQSRPESILQVPAAPQPANPDSTSGEFKRLFDAPPPPADPFASMVKSPVNPPPSPSAPGPMTVEFNRLFEPESPKPAPTQPRPNNYITAQEGESTQMFKAPPRTQPPVTPPPPPKPLAATPPPPAPPGEFTQMFQPGVNSAAPPPRVPSSAPGEFTRLFENPLSTPGKQGETQLPALPLAPSIPAPRKPANEFDELFGGVKAQPRNPPPPLAPLGGLSATSAFSMPPQSQPSQQAPLAPGTGPSSYTQLMKIPPDGLALGQQPAVATPTQPKPASKKPIPPIVFVGAGLVLFLIVIIILVFALGRH